MYSLEEREQCLYESIQELQKINKKMASLVLRKETLTDVIIGAVGHQHEGQKTYEYNEWKIEVKTPCVYSLNKKIYESGEVNLPPEYNPIKESVSYTIDKRLCDDFLESAPKKIVYALSQLIEKKPGKSSVCIKERTQ